LGSCSKETTKHADKDLKKETHQEENTNIVTLQKKQLEVMKIGLGKIKRVNLGVTLKVNGQLELPPQRKASVSAIVGGRVHSVTVIEGDYIDKGAVMAYLDNPKFIAMQRDYLSAKNAVLFLEKEYQRKKALLKEGITSAKDFQKAEGAYNRGKVALNAAKANLQLLNINLSALENGQIISKVPVVAPIKGYVQKVAINIGKFVAPEQEMIEIVDNEHLHIGLKVFEKDIDKAKVGQKIAFSLTTKPEKIYEAKIFALGRAFDLDTRAVKVHAKIVGTHQNLLPGMFVEARIVTKDNQVTALPNGAFVTENGLDYIFVQRKRAKNTFSFEKIQINKGISDLGYSEVVFIKEIPTNAVIVTQGAYYVNAELGKGAFEEHEH